MNHIFRTIDGLIKFSLHLLAVVLTFAAGTAILIPFFLWFVGGYSGAVLLSYVPLVLAVAYLIGDERA
jgi:hypothetical protein